MTSSLMRVLLCVLISGHLLAQSAKKEIPTDWFLKDPEQDSLLGVSSERTYATLLKNQPSRRVLVAVIDSGIDIDHEDLKSIIWVNEKEIAGNGIDDDKNGYVDDVHGWNFIGGKTGNVGPDTYELTREYMRLSKKFESSDSVKSRKKYRTEYEDFLKIKDKYQKLKIKNEQQYKLYSSAYRYTKSSIDSVKKFLNTEQLNPDAVRAIVTTNPRLLFSKSVVSGIYKTQGDDVDLDSYVAEIKEAVDYYEVIVKYGYNTAFDSRKIVGDTYANLAERFYGNNDVKGPDPEHGTHVAGIIGADRNNEIGIKGIADNVRIMAVRAVPNGDERDKDIANAIIYAVDNGAQIINMSFGKSFSPEKATVDKAVKYAEQKGVLLIHAAGNDGDDMDKETDYPTRKYLNGKVAKNWIEVGASSWGANQNFVGNFSNFGKKSVSVFAPGVEIYSTTPNNHYKNMDGTSMASPSVAGVAALLLSYFPDLTAFEIKDILLKSSRKFDNLKVQKPGTKEEVPFESLSETGGLINAYEAVKMAQARKSTLTNK
ncbi:MAG: S8 family serine peptidase [Cyclobacteriaceae bacterium]|nr:S8 family serine peptidase [Cyclobacteriaceae bacterium]